MSVEDIGVIRSIPTMVIFEPVDNTQLKLALPQIINHPSPFYMRMFRKETPDIFDDNYNFIWLVRNSSFSSWSNFVPS